MLHERLSDIDFGQQLLHLAGDRSASGRQTLVSEICDALVGSGAAHYTDGERGLMGEIVGALLHEIEVEIRCQLAQRLAQSELAPPGLVEMMANDEIMVAAPLLDECPVLDDAMLIAIIEARTRQHRLAIAGRKHIGPLVTETLAIHGEDDVVLALVRNPDARLSALAASYLLERSKQLETLHAPLLQRADLPAPLANRMFWWVSSALRRQILKHFPIDEKSLDETIRKAVVRAQSHAMIAAASPTPAERLVREAVAKGEVPNRFLLGVLRKHQYDLFVAAVGYFAGLDRHMSQRVVHDPSGECLAIACKSFELDRNSFGSIFLLTRPLVGAPTSTPQNQLRELLALYDTVRPERARITLRYWQGAPELDTSLAPECALMPF